MAKILLQAWNQGGLSDSKYSGIKNSFARMIGFDIHSKPGLLQVNQRMTKISGSTIDEFCKVAVDCSNGIRYWFSSTSGKIWQEKEGTVTLVYTVAPASGAAGTLGAAEYAGFLYFFTQSRAHRIPIDGTKADGSSAWTTNIQADWAELNLDQETIGGTGATAYQPATSIGEGATAKQTFTVVNNVIEGIRIKVTTKGTSADWTVTVHDSSNNVVASKTLTNANVSVGQNIFEFASPVFVTPGSELHVHVTVSNTTGTPAVDTSTNSDLEAAQMSIFTTSDATYHPTKEVNLVLYIGDKHYVHQIDNSSNVAVFSQAALDLPINYRVTALGKMRTDLLIGTIIASNVARCDIFRWNTYGESFISQDTVYETGINCFLESDNYTIISAGKIGNLYSYNGDQMTFYKKIPGEYSPTKQCIIYPNATALFGFLPVFGVSNVQGDPCDQGVYSLGKHSNNYTNVLNLEFPISQVDASDYNRVTGVKIGAIVASGNDLYISWEYNSTYGVDKLDYTLKVKKPILETRMMSPQAGKFTTFNEYIITYETLPSGTSIVLKQDKDSEGFGSAMNLLNDTSRKQMIAEAERGDARTQQLRLEAVTNSNDAPKIQEIVVDVT